MFVETYRSNAWYKLCHNLEHYSVS